MLPTGYEGDIVKSFSAAYVEMSVVNEQIPQPRWYGCEK
jgi:hypothetical protein